MSPAASSYDIQWGVRATTVRSHGSVACTTYVDQQSNLPRDGRGVAGADKVLFDGECVQVVHGLALDLLRKAGMNWSAVKTRVKSSPFGRTPVVADVKNQSQGEPSTITTVSAMSTLALHWERRVSHKDPLPHTCIHRATQAYLRSQRR
jgi:hypothetical protein